MTERLTAYEYRVQQARLIKSEHLKQVKLFEWVRNPVIQRKIPDLNRLYAVPNGFFSTPGQKAKMNREGLTKGISDVHHDSPRKGYSGFRLEMKHGRGKLTPEQADWFEYWESEGYYCCTCYSHVEAIKEIEWYLT